MSFRYRQEQANIYAPEQVRRSVLGSGISIESEVDTEYIVFCPYHNNYRTPAGEVSKSKGTFFCFSCQTSATLIEFVMFTTRKTFFEATRFIDGFSTETDISGLIDNLLEAKPDFHPYDEFMIKRLNKQALESPRATSYFEGRRISRQSVEKFSLGYSEKQDMITIPVQTPSGDMYVGFVGRSVEGKEFKNTPKLPKSKILFNLHRAKLHDTVYVVESSFDAIRLDQCGIPAVATLGANIPRAQVDLLTKNFNSVIVIPDNDDAGRDMAKRIVEKLGARVSVLNLPEKFKDIGDMQDSDIIELTDKTQSIIFNYI